MTAQDKTITADHKSVHAALCAAQLDFGSVKKGSKNDHFKSKYADLADVASTVIPVLAGHGVCVRHYTVGDDLMVMRTEFYHHGTDTAVACDIPLIVDRNNMQGMKSAMTYAKRIGLESLSGVAPEDDDGNAAAANPPKPKREPAPDPDALRVAQESLFNAETLDQLRALWSDLPKAVQAAPAVIKAKNGRKAELDAPPQSEPAPIDDEIPY